MPKRPRPRPLIPTQDLTSRPSDPCIHADCGLSPMAVSLVYVISPLATSLSSFVAQRLSRRAGRVPTTILFKVRKACVG